MTCRLFSPVSPGSSINKTDRDDIAKILLKVVLNTKNPYPPFCLSVSISYLTKRVFVIVLYLFINDIVLLQYCINQYEALLSWRCIYYLSIHIKSTNSSRVCVRVCVRFVLSSIDGGVISICNNHYIESNYVFMYNVCILRITFRSHLKPISISLQTLGTMYQYSVLSIKLCKDEA